MKRNEGRGDLKNNRIVHDVTEVYSSTAQTKCEKLSRQKGGKEGGCEIGTRGRRRKT
jgi:hypothetical protein